MSQMYQGLVVNAGNYICVWNQAVLIVWSVIMLKDLRMNEGLVGTA